MGNAAQYIPGAYNYLEQKKKQDEQDNLARQKDNLRMMILQNRLNDQDYQRSRTEKRDKRLDKEFEWRKEDRENATKQKKLSAFIKPYVPESRIDPKDLSRKLETKVPTSPAMEALRAAGMSIPNIPINDVDVTINDFKTQKDLEAEKRNKNSLDNLLDRNKALARAGFKRDYNKYPVGSGKHGNNLSNKSKEANGNSGGPKQYKHAYEITGTPDQDTYIKLYKQYQGAYGKTLSDRDIQKAVIRQINEKNLLSYQKSKEINKAKQKPKKRASAEEMADLLAGRGDTSRRVKPASVPQIKHPQQVQAPIIVPPTNVPTMDLSIQNGHVQGLPNAITPVPNQGLDLLKDITAKSLGVNQPLKQMPIQNPNFVPAAPANRPDPEELMKILSAFQR